MLEAGVRKQVNKQGAGKNRRFCDDSRNRSTIRSGSGAAAGSASATVIQRLVLCAIGEEPFC